MAADDEEVPPIAPLDAAARDAMVRDASARDASVATDYDGDRRDGRNDIGADQCAD